MTEIAANLGVQPRHSARRGEPAGPAVWRHRLLAAVRAHFMRAEKPHQPKHYPNYYSFIEHAAMSREMDRL